MGVNKHKKAFLLIAIFCLMIPFLSFAKMIFYHLNGTVTQVAADGTLTINVVGTAAGKTYTVKPTSGTFNVNDKVTFTEQINDDTGESKVDPGSVSRGTNPNADEGTGSKTDPNKGKTPSSTFVSFRLFPDLTCTQEEALTCWIQYTYDWAQGAILLLAVGSFIVAGIVYMTSAGDPKRVALAKKLMTGALSGVAVIVLGRFFLTRIVGVPWL